MDQSDESKCDACGSDSIYCGENKCMSSKHVCDGEIDCPYGQDERNCGKYDVRPIRLPPSVDLLIYFSVSITQFDWTNGMVM